MGRGSSKASGGSAGGNSRLLSQLTDNLDFNAWVRENLKNPDFKQFGRDNDMDEVKQLWFEKRAAEELKNIHEISNDEAVDQILEAIPRNTSRMWFVEANSDFKPKLVDAVMSNPGTLNAGLNVAYQNYKNSLIEQGNKEKPIPFKQWVNTPQTMYRGDRGQKTTEGDIFLSFTTDKKVAAGFTLGDSGSAVSRVKDDFSNIDKSKMTTIKIKPIDTWGSYQTTGEQEFLVPVKRVKRK